jgi:hypothetical protein
MAPQPSGYAPLPRPPHRLSFGANRLNQYNDPFLTFTVNGQGLGYGGYPYNAQALVLANVLLGGVAYTPSYFADSGTQFTIGTAEAAVPEQGTLSLLVLGLAQGNRIKLR